MDFKADDVWRMVIEDITIRRAVGIERYGKAVMTHDQTNDWLRHAYEEVLDFVVYIRAEIERRRTAIPIVPGLVMSIPYDEVNGQILSTPSGGLCFRSVQVDNPFILSRADGRDLWWGGRS